MRSGKKLYLILGAAAIVLLLCATKVFAGYYNEHRKVVIATAMKKNIAHTITMNGFVEPNRKQEISLDENQKVMEVLVAKNQEVKKGDMLLKLDNSDLVHNLNIEKLNLASTEKEYKRLLNSDVTDKHDLEIAVKQVELELSSAKSEYETAKLEYEQSKTMYKSGIIAKGELDSAEKKLAKQENNAADKQLELDKAGLSLKNYESDKADKLAKAKSEIEISRENVKNLENKLGADTMASIDGKVVRLNVEKDQYPVEDAPQLIIYDLSKYIVNVDVRQRDAVYIKQGQSVKVKIKGLDGIEYNGTVEEIEDIAVKKSDSESDPKVNVRVSIQDPDERLRIGYEVEVKIDLSIKNDVVVINFEGLVQEPDGTKYVYCVYDNIANKVQVKTGIETEFEVEILEGPIAGDKYIINPPQKMQEKESVKIWGWGYEYK